MTKQAIEALEIEIGRAKELLGSLSDEEWAAASGCDGWRVQDVVQHMAAVFQQIAAPDTLETGQAESTEATAELSVQARKDWEPARVVAGYDEWSEKGMVALNGLQDPPMAEMVVPMSDLGSHPLHMLANALAFDHYCHLRHDIGMSIERSANLPRDESVLDPGIEWMLAGLPQMCADTLAAAPAQPLNLVLEGPGGGEWTLAPGDDGWTVTEGRDPDAPTIVSTAHDFVSWGTKRSNWRNTSSGDVDSPEVQQVLDAINII